MRRFLITTALEETWRDDQPVLFLGEWCRRYSRKDRWSSMDAVVLPYHWDDRAKLYADYRYLQEFYERLLRDFAVHLNRFHGVDHGLRYWRILIGPWLGYLIQMLFDRWASIEQAVDRYDLSGSIVLTGQEEELVPGDMADFRDLYIGDAWNHQIYGAVLGRFPQVGCMRQARPKAAAPLKPAAPATGKQRLRRRLAAWYSKGAGLFGGQKAAFFIATYLPVPDELRLYRRLGQFPGLWRAVPCTPVPVNSAQRDWTLEGESRSDFEAFVRGVVVRHIPTAYLEGYTRLVDRTRGLPWPRRPKVIWTSNAHSSDDVFKAWAAAKVEEGAPLVIGQHGGHYGVGLWSFAEEHEIAISDRYLTWGWSDPAQPKVRPLGQVKSRKRSSAAHSENPRGLLVTAAMPRYSYLMYSVFVSRQWLDYFSDQCAFVESLPERVRDRLTVRLFPHDYGWDQEQRWRDRFPDLHLDAGRSGIDDLIRQSRVYISTYNATTFLESFTMNIPTVIYWNPNHWELRESAVPYFEDLQRVGVFHENPQSAARHLAAIWDDVDAWWGSPAVRKVLDRFRARFCHSPGDLLGQLENALREVIAVSNRSYAR